MSTWNTIKTKTTEIIGSLFAARTQLPQQTSDLMLVDIEPSAKTFYDSVTLTLIQIIGLAAPLLIAAVLTVGNGYFFSGFHEWTLADPLTMWAYIGGGVLEAVGLGLVYRAARRYRKGDYRGMMFTFTWLIALMLVSIFAQYMFLQGLYATGNLHVPDNAAEHAPLFSILVGVGAMRGHDIVFFVRALAFHIAEIACSFVVVDKAKTATQILAERRELHDAQIAMQRQDLQLEREREEFKQDAEIKRLQHQWLLQQVRQGVVFVNAEPNDEPPQLSESVLARELELAQELDQLRNQQNGHTHTDEAFPRGQSE